MHIQMSSYLLLRIAVFLNSIDDLSISFSLVQDYLITDTLL